MKNIMPPIDTPDNIFHDGNPATGEQGTIVPGLWLTNVQGAIRNTQQELISVLTEAGIEINESVDNQLLLAILELITTRSPELPIASLSLKGIVQLSNSITSTSEGLAASSKAVKTVSDAALKTANNLSEIAAAGPASVAATLANLGVSPHGFSRFTSSGSFIVPEGVFTIWVSGCAAGGGGGSSLSTNSSSFVTGGSGGGAGQPVIRFPITVTPGQVIPVTIGIGGTGATAATNNATAGGNTQLGVGGSLLNLIGGSPGTLSGGGASFPSNFGGPAGGVGYPAGSPAQDTSSYTATTASGGSGGQGASGPFGQAGPAGRGASGGSQPAGAGFGYGAGGSGAGGAYVSPVTAAGATGASGLNGYLAIEW
ncbi:tail fiber repeat 2-containing protein [Yersinia frederiksenii]|uniref:phage tail protein n=2 Tax=Yersinia TaxID=629 RepID=UPI0005EA2870|nr:phage tail protein [Yersinia rohdei]CNI32897.1 tail fiber repeat 2-containing protein [Yersinia frederiksenii]